MQKEPGDAVDWPQVMTAIAETRDRDAFAMFFDHFAPKVKAFSLSRLPGAELVADELVQEVMLKVWDKAGTYRAELASPTTWLFTLVRNCHIDMLRRSKSNRTLAADDLWYEDDYEPDPFAALQQQRSELGVRKSLLTLPEEQLDVLRRVYLQGKSHQQAAEDLGLPLGTVKSRIRLAFKKLESVLRPEQ
ncbi:sigma-70 family RNA polymerase sigma factor [Proteobacteria bacterium 005FR1]|nr:sigma-70 family RNA polymerase sigma factor [Proteobacteria bacterium 005FR1]